MGIAFESKGRLNSFQVANEPKLNHMVKLLQPSVAIDNVYSLDYEEELPTSLSDYNSSQL